MRIIGLTVVSMFFSTQSFSLETSNNNDSVIARKLRDLEERIVQQERKINRLQVENHELKAAIADINSRPVVRLGRKTTVNRIGSKQVVSE
ncbi:MAG TPA: hypothetical protein VLC28_09095 [Flavitalea sp.]|nr:hypothetical protein [Flavitalea sp.]